MMFVTKSPLRSLFDAIAQASDDAALKGWAREALKDYFAAKRCSLFFLSDLPAALEGQPELIQRALSTEQNPILRYVLERHTAVHDEVLLPPGVWKTICPRADHAHVLVGPVLQRGQLIGAVGLTRERKTSAFNSENLADLSALCLHLSSRLEALCAQAGSASESHSLSQPTARSLRANHGLTPRETEIAELVAQGLTNKEIGAALWITENSVKQALKRMFRKLEVASRAEMVMHLYVG